MVKVRSSRQVYAWGSEGICIDVVFRIPSFAPEASGVHVPIQYLLYIFLDQSCEINKKLFSSAGLYFN